MKYFRRLLAISLIAMPWAALKADVPVMSASRMPEVYKQECASCHMAYPPEFLSKSAWQRIMASLKQHYGADASIDAQSSRAISSWLDRHAGRYKRASESSKEDRLTTTPWFTRKHSEVNLDVFRRTAIKSPANCVACHTQAEQGNFDDNFVRIPK